MKVDYGAGKTQYGPGVSIELDGDEVAVAIEAYLLAHGVRIHGPRTITVNGALCESGNVYVDPAGRCVVLGGLGRVADDQDNIKWVRVTPQ